MRTIIGKSAGSTYERLHHDQKQEGAGFHPCLADFLEKRTTSRCGPKTEKFIGEARQA